MMDNLTLLVLGFLMLSAGIALTAHGIRGQRRGREPRCPGCEYNLTGLQPERCPECGIRVDAGDIVYGLRQRHMGAITAGVGLVVFGAASSGIGVFQALRQVDWYRWRTTATLSQWAVTGDRKALFELLRRVEGNGIPTRELRQLGDLALHVQGTEPAPPYANDWYDLAGLLAVQGAFTGEQQTMFYRQVAGVSFALRRTIREGDPVVAQIAVVDRGSRHLPLRLWIGPSEEFCIDGKPECTRGACNVGVLAGTQTVRNVHWEICRGFAVSPGAHRIEYEATFNLFDESSGTAGREAVWVGDVRVGAALQVVAQRGDDPICVRRDVGLDEAVANMIEVSEVVRFRSGGSARSRITLRLKKPAPTNLLAEAFLTLDGESLSVGVVNWMEGGCSDQAVYSPWIREDQQEPVGAHAAIVLRGARHLAAATLACYEVWGGEVRLSLPEAIEAKDDHGRRRRGNPVTFQP
ncbi:MAG TPA: hypothetical protein PKH26_17050 [Phycisphaerae bacterium]|nr:hypothetical protein [Phycisphaerae bacterium]